MCVLLQFSGKCFTSKLIFIQHSKKSTHKNVTKKESNSKKEGNSRKKEKVAEQKTSKQTRKLSKKRCKSYFCVAKPPTNQVRYKPVLHFLARVTQELIITQHIKRYFLLTKANHCHWLSNLLFRPWFIGIWFLFIVGFLQIFG